MQSLRRAWQVRLDLADQLGQPARSGGLRYVAQAPCEIRPFGFGDLVAGELVVRLPGELPELLVVDVLEGGADDAALGQQAGPGEMQDTGQELSPRVLPVAPKITKTWGGSAKQLPDWHRWANERSS